MMNRTVTLLLLLLACPLAGLALAGEDDHTQDLPLYPRNPADFRAIDSLVEIVAV